MKRLSFREYVLRYYPYFNDSCDEDEAYCPKCDGTGRDKKDHVCLECDGWGCTYYRKVRDEYEKLLADENHKKIEKDNRDLPLFNRR